MDAATDDPMRAIEYELTLLARRVSSMPGRSRRRGGELDQSAYTLLTCLDGSGPLTLKELSSQTGLEVSTLNRQTSALTRHGLAERIPDPAGGVARRFRITPRGASALADERDATVHALGRVLAAWTTDERVRFAEQLARFNEAIAVRATTTPSSRD